MEKIPMPILLDPQRPRLEGQLSLDDANQQAHDLDKALRQAADYGRYLWRQIDAVRHYLLEVAPDPDADDDVHRWFTAPRGPDDDHGWDRWKTAYEAITSVLAGPAGDSGFGRHEAAQEALRRRGPVGDPELKAQYVRTAARRAAAAEQLKTPSSAADSPDPGSPTEPAAAPDRSGDGLGPPPALPNPPAGRPTGHVPLALVAAAAFLLGVASGRPARVRARAAARADRPA